jgi:hypothetical protein
LKGLDGLATAGTIAAVLRRREDEGDDDEDHAQPRVGVLLNYSPSRILYVSEPFANSIAVITLTDDGLVFHMPNVSRILLAALNEPIDLAPVTIETSDPNWASNTTLDVQADFYVCESRREQPSPPWRPRSRQAHFPNPAENPPRALSLTC